MPNYAQSFRASARKYEAALDGDSGDDEIDAATEMKEDGEILAAAYERLQKRHEALKARVRR
jgi:hypothetical protein